MDTNVLLIGGGACGLVLLAIGVVAFIRHKRKKKETPEEIYPMW